MRVRTPPWEIFYRQFMVPEYLTVKQVAEELGWKELIVVEFLDGKLPVSRGIAQDLADHTGTGWEVWLNLQDNYDKSIRFK